MGNTGSSFDSQTFRSQYGSSVPSHSTYDYRDKYSPKRRRLYSTDSDDPWGWFDDLESPSLRKTLSSQEMGSGGSAPPQMMQRTLSLPPAVAEPPLYILESNLETQQLWYKTAGQRPQQPESERKYFERLWRANFEASAVDYDDPLNQNQSAAHSSSNNEQQQGNIKNSNGSSDCASAHHDVADEQSRSKPHEKANATASATNDASKCSSSSNSSSRSGGEGANPKAGRKPRPHTDSIPRTEFNGDVLFRGRSPFSNSVSKSFTSHVVSSMTMQLPYYRIFRSAEDGELHAEYLVLVTLGSRAGMTFGVWKRHSDFEDLARKVTAADSAKGSFKNATLSWKCLLQRKRWFKCLDKDYLALKCFLLERFIHDVLFESHSPNLISHFLGID